MGPTWGPSGADRTQVGPMLAPWTLLSGYVKNHLTTIYFELSITIQMTSFKMADGITCDFAVLWSTDLTESVSDLYCIQKAATECPRHVEISMMIKLPGSRFLHPSLYMGILWQRVKELGKVLVCNQCLLPGMNSGNGKYGYYYYV